MLNGCRWAVRAALTLVVATGAVLWVTSTERYYHIALSGDRTGLAVRLRDRELTVIVETGDVSFGNFVQVWGVADDETHVPLLSPWTFPPRGMAWYDGVHGQTLFSPGRHVRAARFPFAYALVPVAALWLATTSLAIRRARVAHRAKSEGRCQRCGYDLRASPERCPECGTVATTEAKA